MSVEYVWLSELIANRDSEGFGAGEVIDSYVASSYADAASFVWMLPEDESMRCEIALGCMGANGVRLWAYVTDGKLAKQFADAAGFLVRDVPQKYRLEFERGQRK